MARATGFTEAKATVRVAVPGLSNLADVQTNFFRLTGPTGTHPDNHWGTDSTVTNIQLVALDVFDTLQATLGINDMSLPQGGMFDICGTWNPADGCSLAPKGHVRHRTGTSVDIDKAACLDPTLQGGCSRGTITVAKNFRVFVSASG